MVIEVQPKTRVGYFENRVSGIVARTGNDFPQLPSAVSSVNPFVNQRAGFFADLFPPATCDATADIGGSSGVLCGTDAFVKRWHDCLPWFKVCASFDPHPLPSLESGLDAGPLPLRGLCVGR